MNGVEYFALTQPDEPSCLNLDFRRCGNMSADAPSVVAALTRVLEHVMPPPPPPLPAQPGTRPLPPPPPPAPLHSLDWSAASVRSAWQLPRVRADLECVGRRPAEPPPRDGRRVACWLMWKHESAGALGVGVYT